MVRRISLLEAVTRGKGSGLQPSPLRLVCIVDPGSQAVRVVVAEIGAEQATIVGWASSSSVGVDGPWGLVEGTLARAEQMAQGLVRRWLPSDQMVVGLPASQVRGWAWPVTQRRTRPDRPVDERELETLLSRVLRLSVNRLTADEGKGTSAGEELGAMGREEVAGGVSERSKTHHRPGQPQYVLMEAVPVMVTVDGRGVSDPVGFCGEELGATVCATLARAETVNRWRQVAEALGFAVLTLTAAPVALAACIPDAQGIVVDVGGAGTALTWVRAGRPLGIRSLPLGGQAVTQHLQRYWGLSWEKAETLKEAHAGRQLAPDTAAQVQSVLAPAVRDWLDGVEEALCDMGEQADMPLPHRFHLIGGASRLPEVGEALRALVWSRRLRFDRYPQFDALEPTDVGGVVNRTEEGRGAGDVAALALAAWVWRESGGGVPSRKHPPDRAQRILRALCEA